MRQISLLAPEEELEQVSKIAKAISADDDIRRAIALQLTLERWGEPRREHAARPTREDT